MPEDKSNVCECCKKTIESQFWIQRDGKKYHTECWGEVVKEKAKAELGLD